MAFQLCRHRRTSSVASGRAKKRNGTNVVPEPRRDVHRRGAPPEDALRVAGARMGEQQPPAAVRDHDLAGVEMTGEDQAPAARRCEVERAREVAEQEAEGGVRRREAAAAPSEPGARVDARELDAAPALRRSRRSRPKQPAGADARRARRAARTGRARTRGRGCRARRTVSRAAEQPLEQRRPARPREQVAGDADEVRFASGDPVDGALDGDTGRATERRGGSPTGARSAARRARAAARAPAPRARAAAPSPPRTTPAQPCERHGARSDGESRVGQIWSFSRIGFTDTTCRLNFSSDSSSPAATPTSCERCRIGIS